MVIQSLEELFSIIEKSKLLSAEQVLAARQSVQGLDDATVAAKKLAREGLITRWQAAQLLAGRSSFLLGKYRLIDLLGRGGMGRVFLARHVTMQRPVALKIVPREVAQNPGALERFFAEARAIAALDHPAIVQAYSVDCEGDRYYIVMEYVDGRDLQRVVEQDGPLDWPTAAEYIRQAADGLAHAHSRDLIHCDVKPSNLLVNSQGQVKILDMGMARLGSGSDLEDDDTANGNDILGSVDYLAPEQALGEGTFDHRADIYSLGCTLYFLLTGHPPFPEGTLPERILKHQTRQPRPIPTERPDVPPQLVQICRRMMAKQPDERFQSAEEVVAALTEAVAIPQEAPATDDAVGTAPAFVIDTSSERGKGETVTAGAVASSGALAPMQTWLSSTSGRLILAGAGLMLLVVLVAGTSIAIMMATGSPSHHAARDEMAAADQPQPTPNEQRDQTKDLEGGEEPDADQEVGSDLDLTQELADLLGPEHGAPMAESPADSDSDQQQDPSGPEPAVPTEPDRTDEPSPPPQSTEPDEPKAEEAAPKTKPKPPRKAPPAEKPQDPLRDIAKAIALSDAVKPGASAVLGTIHLPEGMEPQLELLGGQTALSGNRQYLLEHEDPAPGGFQWLINLRSEPPGGKPTNVALARLAVTEPERVFQIEWLDEAGPQHVGPLRNCVMALRVGDAVAWIGFGLPRHAEPLVVDFAKRNWRTVLVSDAFPETESLRIEVSRIEGQVPKLRFKPANTVKEGETMEIELAEPDTALVTVQLSFTVRMRALRVEAMPTFSLEGIGRWPLTVLETQRVGRELLARQARFDVMLKNLPEKHENRNKVVAERARIAKAIQQLTKLGELSGEIHEQGRIHYRVFTMADDRQVDLWSTEVAPSAPGTAGRPSSQDGRLGMRAPAPPPWFIQTVSGGSNL